MKESINKPGELKNANQHNPIVSKKGGSRGIWILSSLVGVLILLGGFMYIYMTNSENKAAGVLEAQNNELTRQIAEHDSLVDDWIVSMAGIENELRTLQGKELDLIQQSEDPELTPDIRENILGEIEEIKQLLEKNRVRIAQLTSKLKQSNVQMATLQKQVQTLERSLDERDSSLMVLKESLIDREFRLTKLNTVVDSLHQNISGYEENIRSYEIQVSFQNEELNKAYFATGSSRELEELGLITKEGGFLGLGKNTIVATDLPDEPFSRVKIADTKRIGLNAKKAKLISYHPADSYELVANDSLIAYLEITDPVEFWKITRYAVVETK